MLRPLLQVDDRVLVNISIGHSRFFTFVNVATKSAGNPRAIAVPYAKTANTLIFTGILMMDGILKTNRATKMTFDAHSDKASIAKCPRGLPVPSANAFNGASMSRRGKTLAPFQAVYLAIGTSYQNSKTQMKSGIRSLQWIERRLPCDKGVAILFGCVE